MDTTHVRIKKSLNSDLAALATDSGFTKEQLLDMFLSECVQQSRTPEAPAIPPSITLLRRKLGLKLFISYNSADASSLESVTAKLAELENLPDRLSDLEEKMRALMVDDAETYKVSSAVRETANDFAAEASKDPTLLKFVQNHLKLRKGGKKGSAKR